MQLDFFLFFPPLARCTCLRVLIKSKHHWHYWNWHKIRYSSNPDYSNQFLLVNGRLSKKKFCTSKEVLMWRVLMCCPVCALLSRYMKYLYPYECERKGLSSPGELQAAIDSNRREGRRPSYSSSLFRFSPSPSTAPHILSPPKMHLSALGAGTSAALNGLQASPGPSLKKGRHLKVVQVWWRLY